MTVPRASVVMKGDKVLLALAVGALSTLACAPPDLTPSGEASAEDTGDGDGDEAAVSDLPSDDPRWCVDIEEGSEVRVPMTEIETECDAELSGEACEANPNCTAIFGRPIDCPESGACQAESVEFLGCIPFTLCKQGPAIYCRETQGYLLTYASLQGTCTPFWMMDCVTSPDHAASGEAPPDCD